MRINTRNPIALALASLGLLLLIAAVVVDVAFKPPDINTALARQKRAITDSQLKVEVAKRATADNVSQANGYLWAQPDDQIPPAALGRISTLAAKHAVKMTAFRPQKETVAGPLDILPFFVSIDGPFPAVADFIKDIEENEHLLVVNLVQLSTNDQTTHNVTASIGISAYIDPSRVQVAEAKTAAAKPAPSPVKRSAKASQTDAAHTDRSSARGGGKA